MHTLKDLATKKKNRELNREFVEKMLRKNWQERTFRAWKYFTHSYSNKALERACKREMHKEVVNKVE